MTSPYYCLGTDGFGRSETREKLRQFFEIDRYYIVLISIWSLALENEVEIQLVEDVMIKYNIDSEKPSPRKV